MPHRLRKLHIVANKHTHLQVAQIHQRWGLPARGKQRALVIAVEMALAIAGTLPLRGGQQRRIVDRARAPLGEARNDGDVTTAGHPRQGLRLLAIGWLCQVV